MDAITTNGALGPKRRLTPKAGASPKPSGGAIKRIGRYISEKVADIAAEPLAQLGLVVFCVSWFALGLPVEVLTAFLSILAITLTQMVLNKQNEREADAHRRDVALHAKIDELVHASKHARDELAGIEELEEEEIERLKHGAVPAPSPSAPGRARAEKPRRASVAAPRTRR